MRVIEYDAEYGYTELTDQLEARERGYAQKITEALEDGAAVFCAVEDGAILAGAMVVPLGAGQWSIYATDDAFNRPDAVHAVFEACERYAQKNGGGRIMRVTGPMNPMYQTMHWRAVPTAPTRMGFFRL